MSTLEGRIQALIDARDRLWFLHPVVTESAVLPTLPLQDVIARVIRIARKSRSSVAFWADPLMGKSYCIRALQEELLKRFDGCGVLVLEAVEDQQAAEGRLLLQILRAIDYAHPAERELAGKRDQVTRSLLHLSGSLRHLFILIDEAQEFCDREFAWLKAVINALARLQVKVTCVLFGQRELIKRRDELFKSARSDLGERFMSALFSFHGCCNQSELNEILLSLDNKSEFPLGSGWSYTQFLMPRAFCNGFRAQSMAAVLWTAIDAEIPLDVREHGIAMDKIASIIAQVFIQSRDLDAPGFVLTPDLASEAVGEALAP
jgi:hypothetical protein